MTPDTLLAFAATLFSGVLAFAVARRKRWSVASACFCAGMMVLAVDSACAALTLRASLVAESVRWQTLSLIAKSFLPGVWLTFSLAYSRGNSRDFLKQWRVALVVAFLVPTGLAIGFQSRLLSVVSETETGQQWIQMGNVARALNAVLLMGIVLILTNLERTFRTAVGTMRWRIKFLVLGLAIIFGVRIYTRSQGLLFSAVNPAWASVESAGQILGCALIVIGYLRRGFEEIDVYPSRTILQGSLTIILVGAYLFVVGALAQMAVAWGGAQEFPIQAALVLVAITALAIFLLSERVRQAMQRLVSRHFKRPQHDSRQVWTRLTQRTSSILDSAGLSVATARLISETFNVLSVSVWLANEGARRFFLAGSTALKPEEEGRADLLMTESAVDGLRKTADPFDLDTRKDEWAEPLKQLAVSDFRRGGHRVCIPLLAGDHLTGVILLADRVNGIPYTVEEMDLLKCMGDQVAANLLNLRLTEELMAAKEMEAFQTMSAFFVHDLKNTASSLNLMLRNLPIHFDNPDFREDALRGIGSSVRRINMMIDRLSALRHKLEIRPVKCDLNEVVKEALASLNGSLSQELVEELRPLPSVMADREQIRSVVVNLILNAHEALGEDGIIRVETSLSDGGAVLSVVDNGCGMSEAFVKQSLFRPFQTTKKRGLGIGMFQSKMIIEAHRGSIRVDSKPGTGTKFRVCLPVRAAGQEEVEALGH